MSDCSVDFGGAAGRAGRQARRSEGGVAYIEIA